MRPPLQVIFAAKTMGAEKKPRKTVIPSNHGYPGKRKGMSKKQFGELNSEFVSEHEDSEKSPLQLRTARERKGFEAQVRRGLKAF